MTNRLPEAGTSAGARRREAAARSGQAFVALDPRLRGRFEQIADGRVLVIDYLVTRPKPGLPTAALSARLARSRPRGSVTIATIEGVDCVADPRLQAVLREAEPRLSPVAGAVLGQFEIDLDRPLPWLDFLSSSAARRT